jgi:hypothetical protein
MRLLGYLLLALLLLTATLLGGRYLLSTWQPPARLPPLVQDLGLQVRQATVYFLPQDDWLTFPLISQADRARVLTHAAVDPAAPEDLPLEYTLLYQVLDDNRNELHQGTYTHQTRRQPPQLKDGQPVPRNLFADEDVAVAAGQSFILQLEGLPQAAYLRLRLQPPGEPLRNVAARVYYEERLSARRAAIHWERLSSQRREQLAEDVIYPPSLVLPQERDNLLQRQWKPVGPLETRVNQSRLYSLEGADDALAPATTARAPGLFVSPTRDGVLPIAVAGEYLLAFQRLEESTEPVRLSLSHFDARLAAPKTITMQLPAGQNSVRQPLAAGMLLVQSSQPGMLDIHAVDAPGQSLLPEPSYLRARRMGADEPASFALSPAGEGVTPLRLDLRAYGEGVALPAELPIRTSYRLLDSQGQVLGRGELQAQVVPSRFDRTTGAREVADLSEPASFYLRLPAQAAQLELSSTQPLLASAYTRPADLPHRTLVPQDYYAWQGEGERQTQPGWFILRPPPAADPAADVPIQTQSRPPERDPEILAGRYLWQALDPQRDARGARLLVPMAAEDQVRPAGLPSYFSPLPAGTQQVEIRVPAADRQLRPNLLFLRDSPAPFVLQLSIDGKPSRHELSGRRGAIQLPQLSPGKHLVRLDPSAPARWLLNYRYPGPGSYMLRLGYALGDTPLGFTLEKHSAEPRLIGARFYSTGDAGSPTSIRLRIHPARLREGPSSAWTYAERIYEVTPTAEQARTGYILDQQQGRISEGLPLLFELGDDIADGPLQVSFTRIGGAPGYLVLYEILPGEHARTDTFMETDR